MPDKSPRTKTKSRKNVPAKGDVISLGHVGSGSVVAVGRGAKASIVHRESQYIRPEWMLDLYKTIDSLHDLSQAEKESLKARVGEIDKELEQGQKANMGSLERWINILVVMAPDIFDVVIASLKNPLAGIGMVIKKVGDRAKLERKPS